MENVRNINYLEIIKRDWRKITVVALIVVLLTLILTLVQPFLYRASVSIFVVQKSSFSIDAYSASKSEERIANKLAQIVYSDSFFNQVLSSGFDIDKTYFPSDELKRRKLWGKVIEADVPSGLSKLQINIYHQDPNQALIISKAVSYVLTADKRDFIGIDDVDLKVLDSPLVSKYPVRPRVIINLLLGIFLGVILGIAYVIVTYNPERDKFFGHHDHREPHLINYNELPKDESVEADLASAPAVSEIEDIEQVEELAEAESISDKSEEPEISSTTIGHGENMPSFSDEEKIVNMPE